jgi:polysaccharide biosynthesis transport protein
MDMQLRGAMTDPAGGDAPPSTSAAIEQLMQFVRRQKRVLIAGPAIAILLALAYLLVTPSLYTATATLLIDSSPLQVLQNQQQPQADVPLDTIQVGSQVEILESDNVALAVIRKLKLTEDPEFVRGGAAPSATDSQDLVEERERAALEAFESHRYVQRLERTYGLDISFTSRNPVKAAKIANAIADAYIDDQLEAKDQTRRRAGAWLQDRIDALSAQVTAADRAVLEFKEKNKIVDVGQNVGPGAGQLIGERQLADLNTQLSVARGATTEARARLDQIEEIRKSDISQAAGADTLKNDVITRLRNQYLDLTAREANISARYGADHQAAINLRNQMAEINHNIQSELGRVAASYQSDFEIARAHEENLERDLANMVQQGQLTNRDKLGLAELESSAKVYHTIYGSFLQRYTDVMQQQSFPITEARVISPAAPPSHRSKPNRPLTVAIAITMGFIVSLGIAALREASDGVFRTSRQAEQCLQVPCLSVIPFLNEKALNAVPPSIAWRRHVDDGRPPPSDGKTADAPATDRAGEVAFSRPILRNVVDHPLSQFAEAIRAIKMSVQLQASVSHDIKVIGVTSAFPSEGKSTIACNLALLMADAGKRVILLDADLRNPSLARSLAPRPAAGLMELLDGKINLEQAIGSEPNTRLSLLPLVLDEPLAHADETLSSQVFKDLIDQLRQLYDYIIVDLPPVAPVVDVRAALPLIDSLVFVLEWGSTRVGAVQRYLATPEIRERLLGVALNKANLKDLQRFEIQGLYQGGYYANLGYTRTTRIDV